MTLEFSCDQAAAQVKDNGFYVIKDPKMGIQMGEMVQSDSRFNFSDETGFKFWRDNINSDLRIQSLMRALEKDKGVEYLLGHHGWLSPDPTHIITLRSGGQQPDIVTIQVWPNNSTAIYYQGSHMVNVKRRRTPTLLWEIVPKRLRDLGCHGERFDFEQGGMVVFDTRTALDMIEGRSYYYSYFVKKMLKGRPPLVPPPLEDVEEVARLGVYVDESQVE